VVANSEVVLRADASYSYSKVWNLFEAPVYGTSFTIAGYHLSFGSLNCPSSFFFLLLFIPNSIHHYRSNVYYGRRVYI